MGSISPDNIGQFDVCIVGAGPVGAYLAVRLAREGLQVGIFDSLLTLSTEPRAIVHLPILFPEYANVGILEQMREASKISSGITSFRRTHDSDVVEQILPSPNRPGPLAVPQPVVTEWLLEKLSAYPNAKVFLGHRFLGMQEDANGVHFVAEDVQSRAIRQGYCQYLVGADGSKSAVRKAIGVSFEGTTLPYKLIAANLIFPFEKYGYDSSNFLLGSDNPGLIACVSKTEDGRTIWRVSASFPITMSDEEVMQALPDKFQTLCKHLTPDAYELLAASPYKAHQFSVSTMSKGRVQLVGDAAHLANPYSGQSMAAGIFDVTSLAECLVPILKDGASKLLIEEWNHDRLLKCKTILHPLSIACFNAVRDPDVETIGQRHPLLKAMKAGPAGMKMMPTLRTDVSMFEGWKVEKARSVAQLGVDRPKVEAV